MGDGDDEKRREHAVAPQLRVRLRHPQVNLLRAVHPVGALADLADGAVRPAAPARRHAGCRCAGPVARARGYEGWRLPTDAASRAHESARFILLTRIKKTSMVSPLRRRRRSERVVQSGSHDALPPASGPSRDTTRRHHFVLRRPRRPRTPRRLLVTRTCQEAPGLVYLVHMLQVRGLDAAPLDAHRRANPPPDLTSSQPHATAATTATTAVQLFLRLTNSARPTCAPCSRPWTPTTPTMLLVVDDITVTARKEFMRCRGPSSFAARSWSSTL